MTTSGTSIYTYSCSETQEKQTKSQKSRFRQIAFLKFFRVWGDGTFFSNFLLLPPMNTLTWQNSFPEMERAQILLKLSGAAWHREDFQSEKEIMTKC